MNVIILAAGQGTRLRPYTNNIPKCMVEFAGKPIIEHQISTLNSLGLENIVVVGGYCAQKLNVKGVDVIVNSHYDSCNMVSTLFCAQDWMNDDEDLLITYGDIIFERKVLCSLMSSKSELAVSVDKNWRKLWELRMDEPLDDAETLKLGEGNKIIELGKVPTSYNDIQGQYMGLIKIRSDYVRKVKDIWLSMDRELLYDGNNFDNMYMTSFIQDIINRGVCVEAAFTEGGWIEIDSVSDLETYNDLYVQGKLDSIVKISSE